MLVIVVVVPLSSFRFVAFAASLFCSSVLLDMLGL